jgi:hypothetical protein
MDEGPLRATEETGAALAELIREQASVMAELREVAQQARARAIAAVERSRQVRARARGVQGRPIGAALPRRSDSPAPRLARAGGGLVGFLGPSPGRSLHRGLDHRGDGGLDAIREPIPEGVDDGLVGVGG